MKHLINTFNELTPEEKADFIKFYTGGDGNLTDEEKRELESGDTTSIICTAFDIWVAKNLDGGKLIDTFVKKAYEFDLADNGYPDSAKERATAKLNAALDIMNAKYFMDIREKLNPA